MKNERINDQRYSDEPSIVIVHDEKEGGDSAINQFCSLEDLQQMAKKKIPLAIYEYIASG